jgi:hypothetical protein
MENCVFIPDANAGFGHEEPFGVRVAMGWRAIEGFAGAAAVGASTFESPGRNNATTGDRATASGAAVVRPFVRLQAPR